MRAALVHHFRALVLIASLVCVVLLAGGKVTTVARDWLLKWRARATIVRMALGQNEQVWPLLRPAEDPTERTEVVHGFSPLVTSPEQVVASMYRQEDVGIRRGMVLVVGELIGAPE